MAGMACVKHLHMRKDPAHSFGLKNGNSRPPRLPRDIDLREGGAGREIALRASEGMRYNLSLDTFIFTPTRE